MKLARQAEYEIVHHLHETIGLLYTLVHEREYEIDQESGRLLYCDRDLLLSTPVDAWYIGYTK